MFKRNTLTQPSVRRGLLFTGFILFLSYFTYVHNYQTPSGYFWDENFHIPSAQKYLTGTFFMEPHPPLGKMLIALGEKLVDPNDGFDQMINVDFGKEVPEGFSFKGYRLFPVLFAWLTAALMFWIFVLITKDWLMATMLSFLYIFDNALIVHNRGAMLDAPMIFFCVAMMLLFLLMLRWKKHARHFYTCALLYGISLGLVLVTKVLGLIMILLIPALLVSLYPRWKQMAGLLVVVGVSCIVVYVGIWQLHFSIASTVNPRLNNQGYYNASEEYKQLLDEGKTGSLTAFPIMWKDSMQYLSHYAGGTPQLDLCKPEENGSPFFFWPFGARTINYRWEGKYDNLHSYLYLVPNPLGWLAGLLGVVIGVSLLLVSFLHPLKAALKNRFLLATFLGLYISYMVAIAQLDRVMYLYHYFIPLLISFVLFGLVCAEIKTIGKWKVTSDNLRIGLPIFGLLLFLSFQMYRPITYYTPVLDEQINRLNIVKLWDLRCGNCDRDNLLAKGRTCS